jgi:hypothetical protein
LLTTQDDLSKRKRKEKEMTEEERTGQEGRGGEGRGKVGWNLQFNIEEIGGTVKNG